jgi:hypothetical protein
MSLRPFPPSPYSLVLSAMPPTGCLADTLCHTAREIYASCFPWPHDLVSLGVVELFPLVSLAAWHSLTRTSSRNLNKAGLLPSHRLCCPVVPRYYEPFGLPSCSTLTSPFGLIERLFTVSKKKFRAGEGLPSSLHPLSYHADPLTPEDSSLLLQVLNSFHGLHPITRDSASSLPPCEAFLTTRQDSLYVTAWYVARPVSDKYFRRYASTHRFRHTQVS